MTKTGDQNVVIPNSNGLAVAQKYTSAPITTLSGVEQVLNGGNNFTDYNNLGFENFTGQMGIGSNMPGNGQITNLINSVGQDQLQGGMNTGTHAVFTGDGTGGFNISIPDFGKTLGGANLDNHSISGPAYDVNNNATANDLPADTVLHSQFYIYFDDPLSLYASPNQIVDVDAFSKTDAGVFVSDVNGGTRTIKVYDYASKQPAPRIKSIGF